MEVYDSVGSISDTKTRHNRNRPQFDPREWFHTMAHTHCHHRKPTQAEQHRIAKYTVAVQWGLDSTGYSSWQDLAKIRYKIILSREPEYAHSMAKACCGGERYGHVCIAQTSLPRSDRAVRTSCVAWESSRSWGVRIEIFGVPRFSGLSDGWTGFDVHVSRFLVHKCYHIGIDITIFREPTIPIVTCGGLMIRQSWRPLESKYMVLVSGVSMKFRLSIIGMNVGAHTFHILGSYENNSGLWLHDEFRRFLPRRNLFDYFK